MQFVAGNLRCQNLSELGMLPLFASFLHELGSLVCVFFMT